MDPVNKESENEGEKSKENFQDEKNRENEMVQTVNDENDEKKEFKENGENKKSTQNEPTIVENDDTDVFILDFPKSEKLGDDKKGVEENIKKNEKKKRLSGKFMKGLSIVGKKGLKSVKKNYGVFREKLPSRISKMQNIANKVKKKVKKISSSNSPLIDWEAEGGRKNITRYKPIYFKNSKDIEKVERKYQILEKEEDIKQNFYPPPFENFEIFKVFLCEFDIEVGSSLIFIYPQTENEKFLAKHKERLISSMIPERAHLVDEDFNIFFLKESEDFFYGLNYVLQIKNENFARKYKMKSLSIISRDKYIYNLKPLLKYCLKNIFDYSKDDNMEVEKVIKTFYEKLNGYNGKIERRSDFEVNNWRYGVMSDYLEYKKNIIIPFLDTSFEISLNLNLFSEEVNDSRVSLVKLIGIFRQKTMQIFKAILHGKKVLFISSSVQTSDKKKKILSAGAMSVFPLACQLLFPAISIKKRTVPYLSLDYKVGDTSNYIASALNPLFEYKEEYWDLLCCVETGKIEGDLKITKQDFKFIRRILRLINKPDKIDKGVSLEDLIRSHFREYSFEILENIRIKNKKSEIFSYRSWMEEASKTTFLKKSLMDFNTRKLKFISFRKEKTNTDESKEEIQEATEEHLIQIFQEIRKEVRSKEQTMEFLSYFPKCVGSLAQISKYICYESDTIRVLVCFILIQIEETEVGMRIIETLDKSIIEEFEKYKKKFKF